MFGLAGKLFPILCIFLFCFHDSLGEALKFPRGLRKADVIEWAGNIPRRRGPSALVIKSDDGNLLRLELQPYRYKISVTRKGYPNPILFNRVKEIAPGNNFNLQIYFNETPIQALGNITISIGDHIKNITLEGVLPQIRYVEANGHVDTTFLKRLKPADFGTRLNHATCGQLGDNIQLGGIMKRICESDKLARIVKGKSANPASYPWQAAIRKKIPYTNNNVPHFCGASLINECWAVTAGHCFRVVVKSSLDQRYIRVGDYFNDDSDFESNRHFSSYENVQDLAIEAVYKHEDYRTSSFSDSKSSDIALIKLKECAKLGPFVKPVCLPTTSIPYKIGQKCIISGWGAAISGQESTHYPKCLQQGQVTIKKRSNCTDIYKDKAYIYNSNVMLCAGGANGTDACQGDSGGPLVCKNRGRHTLVGLTSWGVNCGEAKYPGVYTRLSRFRKWMYLKIRFQNKI